MTIYSIVNSLTELKEISKVKFLIEGKSSADFKGNFRFNTEFPRSAQLISNKAEPTGTVNSNKDAADKKMNHLPAARMRLVPAVKPKA